MVQTVLTKAKVITTAEQGTHASAGTERCHEAVTKMPGSYDIVINIQGDEPLIDPHVIDDVVKALQESPDSVYRCACLASSLLAHMSHQPRCSRDARLWTSKSL